MVPSKTLIATQKGLLLCQPAPSTSQKQNSIKVSPYTQGYKQTVGLVGLKQIPSHHPFPSSTSKIPDKPIYYSKGKVGSDYVCPPHKGHTFSKRDHIPAKQKYFP